VRLLTILMLGAVLGTSACGEDCPPSQKREGSWGTPTCASDEGTPTPRAQGEVADGGSDGG